MLSRASSMEHPLSTLPNVPTPALQHTLTLPDSRHYWLSVRSGPPSLDKKPLYKILHKIPALDDTRSGGHIK